DDRAAPGELDTAQVGVSKDRAERSERLAETSAQGGRHGRTIAGRLAFLKLQTEDSGSRIRLESAFPFRPGGSHGRRAEEVRSTRRRGRRSAQVHRRGRVEAREVRRVARGRGRRRRGAQALERSRFPFDVARLEAADGEQQVAVEPEVGELPDEALV